MQTIPDPLDALADELRAGRAIAFIGAGVSASLGVGYPTWTELLETLHREVTALVPSEESKVPPSENALKIEPKQISAIERVPDLLWRAEEYRQLLESANPKRYHELIAEKFGPLWQDSAQLVGSELVAALTALPFRCILNTNFDPSLEAAYGAHGREVRSVDWSERARVHAFLSDLWSRRDPSEVTLVYLHGKHDLPQSIVLTERDYADRYLASDESSKKLFALLISHCVVFVGFSLNDPELTFLLRVARAHARPDRPQHYAFLPAQESPDVLAGLRRMYRGKYGVEPIYFDTANNYVELVRLLQDLARRTNESARAKAGDEPPMSEPPGALPAVPPPIDPEDPNKGQFGGTNVRNGLKLDAHVEAIEDDDDWFHIEMWVEAVEPREFEGTVIFHLHPTFQRQTQRITVKSDKRAELERWAYGAFTVGVEADDGATRLELDLATLPGAPRRFRMR